MSKSARKGSQLALLAVLSATFILGSPVMQGFAHNPRSPVVDQILEDCQDGNLHHSYPRVALVRALANMPDDIRNYTPCEDVIKAALKKKTPKSQRKA